MVSSRFSTLVYRIIGKPEIKPDEYADIMHNVLDDSEPFADPDNLSELEVGEQILNRIRDSNEALSAFSTLLDNSRFKIVILDHELTPIYNNKNAVQLYEQLKSSTEDQCLNPALIKAIQSSLKDDAKGTPSNKKRDTLIAIDYLNNDDEQLYLRSVQNHLDGKIEQPNFYLLLVLDQNRQKNELSSDLINKYELTVKEQKVLINLIHGRSIKQISEQTFVSENTVKTHLKSLFRKTCTKSQTDIVRLILTHESQILDSYFDTSAGVIEADNNAKLDKFITLKSGHDIAYREYGPSDGYPIIVFHNSYGTRHMIPNDYDAICAKHKRRIIIPDRPGYGFTEFIENHPVNWNDMLNEFIEQLNIKQYDVLGSVLGCPLALSFAAQAGEGLQRLTLSSPVILNQKSDIQYLLGILAPASRIVGVSQQFARETYELWLKSVTLNLGKHYRNMINSSVGSAEKDKFQKDDTVNLMVNTFREAGIKTINGMSYEMLFFLAPLKLDLSKVTIPVDLWWGTEDTRISQIGVENLHSQLSNSKLHIKEGYSEHIYFALFEEMIR